MFAFRGHAPQVVAGGELQLGAARELRMAAALSAIRKHLSGSYAHARCALRAHAGVKFSGSCAGGCALTSNSGKKLVKTNF